MSDKPVMKNCGFCGRVYDVTEAGFIIPVKGPRFLHLCSERCRVKAWRSPAFHYGIVPTTKVLEG